MIIVSIHKFSQTTIVHVSGISEDRQVSDDVIAGFAMHAAKETPNRLFGWTVRTYGTDSLGYVHGATVELHRD